MNMQQVAWSKLSANGFDHRRAERDPAAKFRTGKMNSSKSMPGGGLELSARDRLMYITTCFIGHNVEVQLLDGSIFSGVFHAINAEDLGVMLKMARLIKDGSREQSNTSDSFHKRPARTLIIPAMELVQVIAKGVPITKDGFRNELQQEKMQELLTDSCISQSRHLELGRELEPWIPDEDIPVCPELDNIFDGSWQRGWDQFEANATLFGVKSTFNEELYTTRLERGPQMRELEREASRIAREIEGEDTLDLHLAEERGLQLNEYLDVDEETRFSSVPRRVDDSGYEEIEDRELDYLNDETFGDISSSKLDKPLLDMTSSKTGRGGSNMASSSSPVEEQSSLASTSTGMHLSVSENYGQPDQLPKPSFVIGAKRASNSQFIEHRQSSCTKENIEKQQEIDQNLAQKGEGPHLFLGLNKESSDKPTLSSIAREFDPSGPSFEKLSSSEPSECVVPPKTHGTSGSHARPSSSASSTSDHGGAASTSAGRGLSSCSSRGSLTSEKSTLNPHAKEFKLNPNAKSFVPSQPPLRPSSPIADNPFYYQANMGAVTQMHGMPVGIGIGPSFPPQQPVVFNPQGSPIPQPYYHPNAPQYGQQMMVGQPRPVLYMPTYPPEMPPYSGRNF